jgi:glyoxylase I family protein
MIRGIDHIELIVRDFDEYVAFMKTLGFEELTRTSHHGQSVELKAPGVNQPIFEIHQATGEEVIGVNHIAFGVDDTAAAHATLKSTNINMKAPNFVESTGRTTINLRDPDGWRMQLVDAKRQSPG